MITELASNNLIDNGVVVLQYADDIVLCLGNDMDGPWNMKLLLYLYETMSVRYPMALGLTTSKLTSQRVRLR